MENTTQKAYSKEALQEFEQIILHKLDKAREELRAIQTTLSQRDDLAQLTLKSAEDSAEVEEKENLSKLATRQQKFIMQLEAALARIKNGNYGICAVTGELIDAERLRVVPHTTQSVFAKTKLRNQ